MTLRAKDAATDAGDNSLEQELSRAIRQAAPEVVRRVIDKAREGSYLHAKFLFELAGLDLQRDAKDVPAGEESLAALLLRELREPRGDTETQPEG